MILGYAEQFFGGWGSEHGAEAEPWVIEALGAVPSDGPAAAEYLATAAKLPEPRMRWEDHPARWLPRLHP